MMISRPVRAGRAFARAPFFAAVVAALSLAGPAGAQSPTLATPAVGMGGAAFDNLACGPDALAANPATLARPCAAPVRILLLPAFGLEAVGNGAGSELWRHRRAILDAFDEQSFAEAIDPGVRDDILARIPAEGYRHRTRLHLPIAQAGLGRHTAVSLTFTADQRGLITRDLAELALTGYEDGRTSYVFEGTDERASGYWTLALGHGWQSGDLDVGITARVISGTFLTRWQAFDPEVSIIQGQATAQVVGAFAGDKLFSGELFSFRGPDGLGYSIDMGAIRDVGRLRVGFAVQNLMHRMSWSDDIHIRTLTFVATPQGTDFESDESIHDPEASSAEEARVASQLREEARFPRRYRASATFAHSRLITLGAGAIFHGGNGQLDRDWERRFSVGGQIAPLRFLRLHAGAATDMDRSGEWSGGLELDLARTRLGVAAARISEPGDMGGWRVVAGLSRF